LTFLNDWDQTRMITAHLEEDHGAPQAPCPPPTEPPPATLPAEVSPEDDPMHAACRAKRDHCVASVRAGLFPPHDEDDPDGAIWILLRAAARDQTRDDNRAVRRGFPVQA
jgi:hypothetical protein